MRVAAHGNVDEYCAEHGMVIVERYVGDVEDYRGPCSVLVTDNCDSENEYYYRKYKLHKRRIELVSTHWCNADVSAFVRYMESQEKAIGCRPRGRAPFGFRRVNGELVMEPKSFAVAQRIIDLRDAGCTYSRIAEEEGICYPDGRKLSVSTVQVILGNRSKYED